MSSVHGLNGSISKNIYILCICVLWDFSLGQTALCFLFLCLMINWFEGHFLCEQRLWCIFLCMWNGWYFPRGKLHSEKTSLVVTHSLFIVKSLLPSWILLTLFVILSFCWMKFGWCHPVYTAEVKPCLFLASCWSQYEQCSSKTKMAGQTSCTCK